MLRLVALIFSFAFALPALAANSTFTLPSSTTAYTAGQLMANSATGASVVVPSFSVSPQSAGFDVIVARGELFINDTTAASWNGQTITIHLWSAAPTFTNGDRSIYSPTTGTANHLAAFDCVMSSIYGDGVYGECSINTGNAAVLSIVSPTRIWWTAVAKTGSGTTGASKTVTFIPEIYR
jgi:hypothetical protein